MSVNWACLFWCNINSALVVWSFFSCQIKALKRKWCISVCQLYQKKNGKRCFFMFSWLWWEGFFPNKVCTKIMLQKSNHACLTAPGRRLSVIFLIIKVWSERLVLQRNFRKTPLVSRGNCYLTCLCRVSFSKDLAAPRRDRENRKSLCHHHNTLHRGSQAGKRGKETHTCPLDLHLHEHAHYQNMQTSIPPIPPH